MAVPNHRSCTENDLVALLKKKDEGALKEVYDRYWYRLFRHAFNLLSDEDAARDVVQELFISLWEKIDDKEICDLRQYLFQSLKYRVFMQLRRKYTSQKHLDRISHLSQQKEYSTEQSVDFSQASDLLNQGIQQLPERCREVFCLSRYEHLSNREIAERLKISVKTVENQITKALKLLRVHMTDLLVVMIALLI